MAVNLWMELTADSAHGHEQRADLLIAQIELSNRILRGGEMPQSNEAGTLIVSAARIASATSARQINIAAGGVICYVNVTAVPGGAETLTPLIEYEEGLTGVFGTIQAGPVITGTGNYRIVAAPSNGVSLDRYWRLNMVHSAVGSWIYSATFSYVRG